jgi:carboxylesterase type B
MRSEPTASGWDVFLDLLESKTLAHPLCVGYFDHGMPNPEHPEFGVFYSGGPPYVFLNLDRIDAPWAPYDRKLAHTFSSYVVNFVSTGDPNGKDSAVTCLQGVSSRDQRDW